MAGEGVGVTQRVINTTISNWADKISDLAVNRYILLALLKKKGLIKFGQHGGELRWVIRYRDHDIEGHVDGAAKTFQRVLTTKNMNLPWRGYESTEAITLMEKLQNGGKEAVIKVLANRLPLVREGLMRRLSREWFKDGNATANAAAQTFHGFDSFTSVNTQTDTDRLATTPNDTYAGQSTAYTAHKSGAVKGTDEEYGATSPVLVHTGYDPGSGALAWSSYADEYLRHGIIEACYGSAPEDMLDLILLNRDAYRELLNLADDKERLVFDRGEGLDVVKMGFKHFVEFDGVSVGWDASVPDTDDHGDTVEGYGFNTDQMELCLLNPGGEGGGLWAHNTTFNSDHQADRMYFYCLGNLKFKSPKFFAKWADLS
jgi:hypothetical protein